jgi:predicted phage replisome organizer
MMVSARFLTRISSNLWPPIRGNPWPSKLLFYFSGVFMSKKYWLKLNAHFLKESFITYLKTQKNGYEYIYLWQSLLLKCLEVDDENEIGFLRLNEKVPYSPELFSEIFCMNVDTVKIAIDLFVSMGVMEILDDGTIYIEAVQKMIGKESESAERVRLHRERKNNKLLQCNNGNVTCNPILYNKEKEEDKDKEEDKEKKNKKNMRILPNSLQEVIDYAKEKNMILDTKFFYDYFTESNWIDSNGKSVQNFKLKMQTWNKNEIEKQKEKHSQKTDTLELRVARLKELEEEHRGIK